jgi:hypothetical protein
MPAGSGSSKQLGDRSAVISDRDRLAAPFHLGKQRIEPIFRVGAGYRIHERKPSGCGVYRASLTTAKSRDSAGTRFARL